MQGLFSVRMPVRMRAHAKMRFVLGAGILQSRMFFNECFSGGV